MGNKNFKNDWMDNLLFCVGTVLILCFLIVTIMSVFYA